MNPLANLLASMALDTLDQSNKVKKAADKEISPVLKEAGTDAIDELKSLGATFNKDGAIISGPKDTSVKATQDRAKELLAFLASPEGQIIAELED